MFRITAVGLPGWFGVSIVIVAEDRMIFEERRLRSGFRSWPPTKFGLDPGEPIMGRSVAVVENWRIEVEPGEKFVIRLDKKNRPEKGDLLPLTKVMRKWPLRKKWSVTVVF